MTRRIVRKLAQVLVSLGAADDASNGPLPRRQGRSSQQHGADTLGLVEAAIAAGFGYVSGQGIAPVLPKPRNSFRLNPTP